MEGAYSLSGVQFFSRCLHSAYFPKISRAGDSLKPLILLAHRERFELSTPRFVVWCSIQLSYRC